MCVCACMRTCVCARVCVCLAENIRVEGWASSLATENMSISTSFKLWWLVLHCHGQCGFADVPNPSNKLVGQNRIYPPYKTLYLVIFLPIIPYIYGSGQPQQKSFCCKDNKFCCKDIGLRVCWKKGVER